MDRMDLILLLGMLCLIGGTLLMLAAALILYKNKRGEVLGS